MNSRRIREDVRLFLVAIPVLLWTLIPIYHLFILSISNEKAMLAGKFWPDEPTLQNYRIVLNQQHYYLNNFWLQLFNSFLVAAAVGIITLFVATLAAFSISRLRTPGGRTIMNLALATYLIPAAFLAVPMYKAMGSYGMLNSKWALILAMVALASPYAIWVLKQASDKLPAELDEAAVIDGASPLQIFRLVYLPLMAPSMVAIGVYALLLAWNEYLYAFLLLSNEKQLTLAVALGQFLGADDSPWNILMATGMIYALPPMVIYYTFRKYMVSGLTAGAVKS
jgi:multiple sugar transport system permease protein